MGNTPTLFLTSLRLKYHFYYIAKYRKEAIKLIDSKVPCTDLELVNLSNRIQVHGIAATRIWKKIKSSDDPVLGYNYSIAD